MRTVRQYLTAVAVSLPLTVLADPFTLTSTDIAQGELMAKKFEYNGFGCSGDDLSPQLQWSNAPVGTKSFAITLYDPDAATGSGWWHWQIVDIPADVHELKTDAGSTRENHAPAGSYQVLNDYSTRGYGGPCPPVGDGVHRYRFTVYALSVEKLNLPENASGAFTGYMINANALGSATLEALFERK